MAEVPEMRRLLDAEYRRALLPEDLEWLTEHGWQDPGPYPEIGTERLRWLS